MIENLEQTFLNPRWENGDERNRIICDIEMTTAEGRKNRFPAAISPGSEDYDMLVKQYSELMDEHWKKHVESRKERQAEREEKHQEKRQREQERIKQEKLFAKKLELFEIDIIKGSKDRKLKSLIRKAKSESEAMLYAGVLVNREYKDE